MSQTGTVDGSESNGSVLWGSAVNPRREQGQHVPVVALTIKLKKKGGGSAGQEQTLSRDLHKTMATAAKMSNVIKPDQF